MKDKKCLLFIFSLLGCLMFTTQIFASEFNFAVTTQQSENQIDKNKTYFDLLLAPNQEDTLNVSLRNDTDQEVTVQADISSATTNNNGVVEYSKNKIKPDKTLRFNLADYVTAPTEIVLKPHSSEIYTVKIRMPNEKYEGIIAGGITFKEKLKEETTDSNNKNKGLAIKNEYSYVVALLMRQSKNNGEPDLKLLKANAGQVNARNVIQGNLQNPNSVYLNQLVTQTKITEKGKNEILYEDEKTNLQMAPNSNFNLAVPLNGEHLKPGKYMMKIEAYGQKDENGAHTFKTKNQDNSENYRYYWALEKEFEIKADIAKKLNESDVTIKKDYTWLYLLVGLLLLLLLLLLLFLIKRKKKKDEENDEKNKM